MGNEKKNKRVNDADECKKICESTATNDNSKKYAGCKYEEESVFLSAECKLFYISNKVKDKDYSQKLLIISKQFDLDRKSKFKNDSTKCWRLEAELNPTSTLKPKSSTPAAPSPPTKVCPTYKVFIE